MNFKPFLISTVSLLLLSGMMGCTTKQDSPFAEERDSTASELTINGLRYRFSADTITQLTVDDDPRVCYGVISDIHGEIERTEYFVRLLRERDIDAILVPGDLVKNEHLRYGLADQRDDFDELAMVLAALGKSDLPVLLVPGNHERKDDWSTAIAAARKTYPNILDMAQYRRFDGDDADIVSLPGYQIKQIPGRQFIPDDGFWATPTMIRNLGRLRDGLDDPVVLLTHGPPYTGLTPGPGMVQGGEDVGVVLTTTMMKEKAIPFAVVGHIHEAGGSAATLDGKNMEQGKWSETLVANFGTLETWLNNNEKTYQGMAGILTIDGKKGKYEMIVVEE